VDSALETNARSVRDAEPRPDGDIEVGQHGDELDRTVGGAIFLTEVRGGAVRAGGAAVDLRVVVVALGVGRVFPGLPLFELADDDAAADARAEEEREPAET